MAAISVRQSKDWMVVRCASPALRTASTTRRAKVSGSGVSAGLSGDSLVSMLKRGVLPERLGEVEQLGKRRDALAVGGRLPGELLRVFAARLDAADVVALQLRQRQAVDGGTRRGEPLTVGPAHDIRVQHRIVRQHDNAVLGDGEVGFQAS